MKENIIVLVIDPDQAVREYVSFHLARQGFEVIQAIDGRDAVRLVAGREINVVVSGLVTTEGESFLSALKAIDPATPNYILLADNIDPRAALNSGIVAVLPRPPRIEDLLTAVNRSLLSICTGSRTDEWKPVEITEDLDESYFGRSGFRCHVNPGLRTGMTVHFAVGIRFGSEVMRLEGQGMLRWVSSGPDGKKIGGVEMLSLVPESRVLFLAWLNVRQPVAQIPG